MSDLVPLTITYTDQQRIGWAAHRIGRSPRKFLEDLIHELAAEYPLPPARPPLPPLREREAARYRAEAAAGLETTAIAIQHGVPVDRVRRVRDGH